MIGTVSWCARRRGWESPENRSQRVGSKVYFFFYQCRAEVGSSIVWRSQAYTWCARSPARSIPEPTCAHRHRQKEQQRAGRLIKLFSLHSHICCSNYLNKMAVSASLCDDQMTENNREAASQAYSDNYTERETQRGKRLQSSSQFCQSQRHNRPVSESPVVARQHKLAMMIKKKEKITFSFWFEITD